MEVVFVGSSGCWVWWRVREDGSVWSDADVFASVGGEEEEGSEDVSCCCCCCLCCCWLIRRAVRAQDSSSDDLATACPVGRPLEGGAGDGIIF